ncbi:MAG: NAD-dependent deacylase [bacterium]|nr:NAD-dependent deacylase [bacterium]
MVSFAISNELRARLERGGPILALTGAGVSAESGLATFRGPGGMWEGRDPMELATPQAFAADPETVWRFYDWRRKQAAEAAPNPAHVAFAALEQGRDSFRLVTQNVDGLHERAGNRDVLRLHGSLWRLRCLGDCEEHDNLELDLGPLPPRCACGALLRPAVVWFGEPLDPAVLHRAEQFAEEADLVIVAGTSALVYPAAALPEIARLAGAYVVEVNPETTPLSERADVHIAGSAGAVLPRLVEVAGIA